MRTAASASMSSANDDHALRAPTIVRTTRNLQCLAHSLPPDAVGHDFGNMSNIYWFGHLSLSLIVIVTFPIVQSRL